MTRHFANGPHPYPCVVVSNWTDAPYVDVYLYDKRRRARPQRCFTNSPNGSRWAMQFARELALKKSWPLYRGIVYADGSRWPRWRKVSNGS